MIGQLLHQIRAKAHWHTRHGLMALAGAAMLVVGAVFVLAAIWLVLADRFSPLVANLLCGAVFLGSGLLVLALRRQDPEPRAPRLEDFFQSRTARSETGAEETELPALIEAFLVGASVYNRMRDKPRK